MLLLMDRRIPGIIRERMIISYYRYKGAATVQHMDEVVKLCRSTGYIKGGKRPVNYPEELFARFPIDSNMILLIISKLRQSDIYNHTSAYPQPQHRSIALSAQGSMLYVILYFAPEILYSKENIMREIVDKHWPDQWMCAFYMGYVIDLSDAWAPYKAATNALKNVLDKKNVEEITLKHCNSLPELNKELNALLTEGVLVEEYVLEHVRKLLHTVRECNFTIRWLLLHRSTSHKKYREYILNATNFNNLFDLLQLIMHSAQFEFYLKSLFKQLLDSKMDRWNECKKESSERMMELSSYFSGTKELTKQKKNDSLVDYFKKLSEEISTLDYTNSVMAGRKITQLISALEEIQEFHQIESNLQIKQFLSENKELLIKMLRTVNINQKILGDLDIITDFSYAWDIIHDYTNLIHEKIKKNPLTCLLLRSTFLKLASILSSPLVRITQAGSNDDISVADYFSGELVSYVRYVLDIIPKSVFNILEELIQLQTNSLQPIPTKLERKYLKDFSQLEHRYTLAKATHQVSVFAQGILAMRRTILGIIKLDPRQLLEDGIRRELVRQLTTAMHTFLVFKTGSLIEFETRLNDLGKKLDGFRQSFEYISDYIGIYGLKIWQEEMSRIIHYSVEQECNSFLRKKVYDRQSRFQSDAIPIPNFAPIIERSDKSGPFPKPISVNFTGRLTRELLAQTDPKNTVYIESMQGWYDAKLTEVVGIRTFSLLHRGQCTYIHIIYIALDITLFFLCFSFSVSLSLPFFFFPFSLLFVFCVLRMLCLLDVVPMCMYLIGLVIYYIFYLYYSLSMYVCAMVFLSSL
jgi:WASH complex subunit strumpellin